MEIGIVLLMFGLLATVFVFYGRGSWRTSWENPQSTQADHQTLQGYEKRAGIFVNGSEEAFFNALIRHKIQGYHVFTKVRLEDILRVHTNIKDQRKRWEYRGRIKSRHVDFVICDQRGKYICGIELDGSVHENKEVKMVDKFKNSIFHHAHLPLYRVRTGQNFDQFSQELWGKIRV